MKKKLLKTLLKGLAVLVKGSKDKEITGISADSRTVAPGNLFLAKKGHDFNGVDFIPQAIAAGAAAIVTDLYDPFYKVPQGIVEQPGALEAILASRFYEEPSKELFVAGITGTKGKTTSTYLVQFLLEKLGRKTGLLSTVEMMIGEERYPSSLTTQSAIQNQKLFREMRKKECTAVAMEVSSHGLDQGRVDAIDFDVAVFTNLYSDHLEYHKNIDEYAAAKRTLFQRLDQSRKKNKRALINGDNEWAYFMQQGCKSPIWTFGIDQNANLRASDLSMDQNGTRFLVTFEGKKEWIHFPLLGRFNVYNALGAIGIGLHLGASLSEMGAILSTFSSVPGRLERVPNAKGAAVFVDYSHTGEALENVLFALREIAPKKIICVFGCGGNRDPGRRKKTAEAAEKYADIAIITSDNPRKEDPDQICEEIRRHFSDRTRPIMIVDRKTAIREAITRAEKDDIVLIAGKGHEKMQIFAHQTIPFDDVLVAKECGMCHPL